MMRWIIGGVLVFLAGCSTRYYWNKPGAEFADFSADHQACVREHAVQTSANRAYGLVHPKLYQACMRAHGWWREEKSEPIAGGWFRGIEDDDIVRLDAPPPQPEPTPQDRAAKENYCRRAWGLGTTTQTWPQIERFNACMADR